MSGRERRPDLVLAALSLALAGAVGCDEKSPSPLSERHQRPVVISEIMYHPVREDSDAEEHEFIELHNRSDRAVALAGWKLTGAVTYTFPADTTLGPHGYLVVARNKERLAADVPSYRLEASALHGPYTGGLDNGGERLLLVDAGGDPMDEALYDDERPWPLGADALGAGEDWLPPALLPLERHRFMGRSLERISFDHAGTSAANWAASALDGATPGRQNGYRGPPLPVIEAITVTPDRADGPPRIGAEDGARIRVTLARVPGVDGSLADAQVEYFVDDIERVGEPTEKVALTPAGDRWEAQIPRQPVGSVVRYRVVGNRGAGPELLSPLASDPHPFHAYFVEPEIPGQTPVYQLFISKADWTDLWLFSQAGRVPDNGTGTNPAQCQVNPRWGERVPAILVVGGRVHDVRVRYQGSFQNRLGGFNVDPMKWPETAGRPVLPSPLRTLSWSIKFPRYDRFEGKRSFNLNKLTQSCHGFTTLVGNTLFERAGVPAARSQYVRYYINGAYYHYMLRMEHMDDDFIQRVFGKGTPGDLFKAVGGRWDEGPFGYSDMRPLAEYCGYTLDQRYEATYSRSTNEDWKSGGAEMRKLIEDLHAARAAGLPAVRRYFETNFAMEPLMNYMAVINWMVGWDDHYHNHYFYRRTSDGRWMMMPTDLDNMMGGSEPAVASGSFFSGQYANRSNRNDYWSYLKDAFLRAFRQEFIDRVTELSKTVLHPDAVAELADEVAAQYQPEEALAAPALRPGTPWQQTCGPHDFNLGRLKRFAYDRTVRIGQGLFD